MLTAHLHLLSRLRISGNVPMFSLCPLMAFTEKKIPVLCTVSVVPSFGGSQGMILITHCIASTDAG
jgi:hypothetical protein